MASRYMQPYILYAPDMQKQHAHVHWETKNPTWVRLSIVLQRMGIKNRYFFLALLQPELKHVDTHDPHLSDEIKARILVEAKLNPWYFFRECLRVPAAGGDNAFFELHRGNLAALWSMLGSRDCFLVQPRQTGKSYVSGSYFTYLLFVATSFYQIGHYNKDAGTGADLVRKIKELKNGLPPWMVEKSTADIDRKESLGYAKLHNEFKTFAAPIDERSAYKLGRKLKHCVLVG